MARQMTDNMINALKEEGLNPDELKIVEIRGFYAPDRPGEFCEALLVDENGQHFLCGEPSSGAMVMKMTADQASKWVLEHVEMPLM